MAIRSYLIPILENVNALGVDRGRVGLFLCDSSSDLPSAAAGDLAYDAGVDDVYRHNGSAWAALYRREGRAGGQTLTGGTASGEDLTLSSTAHATKGSIFFGGSAYDEVNNRLGIGTASPSYPLHVRKSVASDAVAQVTNLASNGYSGITFTDEGETPCFFCGVDNNANNVRLNAVNSFPMVLLTQGVERMRLASDGNIGLWGSSFGSGALVLFIGNRTTAPTSNPTGGGILYAESGALKYRGSGGTVTTIANA